MKDSQSNMGGAISLESSDLAAFCFNASNCSALDEGGAIRGNGTSTFLCAECSFTNNSAGKKGGAVSMESSKSQLLAIQFDKTIFHNNVANYGGHFPFLFSKDLLLLRRLHVITSDYQVDCSKHKANCTFVVLRDTAFKRNRAFLGASLFVNNLPALRINCSSKTIELQLEFFKRWQWESMKVIQSKSICKEWKGNKANGYGNNIATYAAHVHAKLEINNRTKSLRTSEKPTVIENYASGSKLPTILLQLVDALGQGPAVGVCNDVISATMSSLDDRLFFGTIVVALNESRGNFTEITAFRSPGKYRLEISFNEESLKPLPFVVEVRKCIIGETSGPDDSICILCNAATFNFRPEGKTGCLPCPEHGNCTTSVIVPEKGYWHSFPCSEHIQRCLTIRVCDFGGRNARLTKFVESAENCHFSEAESKEYQDLLCKPVRQLSNINLTSIV